jgi:hypothetical protein
MLPKKDVINVPSVDCGKDQRLQKVAQFTPVFLSPQASRTPASSAAGAAALIKKCPIVQ